MVRSVAWKGHERAVANSLKGHRIPRGANFSSSLPDVVADSSLSIARSEGVILAECKHSINNPWVDYISSIYNKKLLYKDDLIFFQLEHIHLLSTPERIREAEELPKKNIAGYLIKHIKQVTDYKLDLFTNKDLAYIVSYKLGIKNIHAVLPLVCLAKKHKQFRLAYVNKNDLIDFYTKQNAESFRKI